MNRSSGNIHNLFNEFRYILPDVAACYPTEVFDIIQKKRFSIFIGLIKFGLSIDRTYAGQVSVLDFIRKPTKHGLHPK